MPMLAKGSTLRTTLDFVARDAGADALDRALERLDAERRARVVSAAATDEIPLDLAIALWRAVDAEIGGSDPAWIERAGAHSIESSGQQLYHGILRKATPQQFLTQGVSLFRLYYHPGNMEVVEEGANRAVLRLVGFDATDRLFCRRQTGGLRQTLVIAGGEAATSRHVRCTQEGDAFCEWELRWR